MDVFEDSLSVSFCLQKKNCETKQNENRLHGLTSYRSVVIYFATERTRSDPLLSNLQMAVDVSSFWS